MTNDKIIEIIILNALDKSRKGMTEKAIYKKIGKEQRKLRKAIKKMFLVDCVDSIEINMVGNSEKFSLRIKK